MIDKDDEEEKGGFGQSKYPCMPSLVALQQMRNRLHLAYLGKKLMKWTAMATARELRRICLEMKDLYKHHSEDVSDCYIMLARCRYYYPNINDMVLENVPKKVSVVISSSTKTVSGVRIFQYAVEETGEVSYEYLGLDRGGDLIRETKQKWKELLIEMVKIVELRSSYILVEAANKSATKRQNVLGKLVIPKTLTSLAYIMLELQEMAREELFRIKKVVEIKKKKNAKLLAALKKQEPKQEEPEPELTPIPEVAPDLETPAPETETELETGPALELLEVVQEPMLETPVSEVVPVREFEPISAPEPISVVILEPEPVLQPIVEQPTLKITTPPEYVFKPELILPSKSKEIEGCCAAAKLEMQRILDKYNLEESKEFDASILKRLAAIKKQIEKLEKHGASITAQEIIPPMEDGMPSRTLSTAGTTASLKSKPSVDSRKKAASTTSYPSVYEDAGAIEHLRKQVEGIERLTSEISAQVASRSFDRFLNACKDFKGKLSGMTPKPSRDVVSKLTAQLDEAIRLSKEAKVCNFDKDKVKHFVEACEEIKRQINRREATITEGLTTKIGDIVSLLSRLRREGMITASVEQILRNSAPKDMYDDDVEVDDIMLDLPSGHGTLQINSPVLSSREQSLEETIIETVKIIRIRNPDGTITEKREIVITTEINNPSRSSSKNTNVNYLFVPGNSNGFQKTMSAEQMAKKKSFSLKQCISTAGTTDTRDKLSYFEGYDDDFDETYKN